MSPMRTLLSLAATAMILAPSAVASADKCEDKATDASKGKNFHVEYVNGKKVHVIDTVIEVCGKVPRPSVVYVLQAKTINYEWENLKQDFLPLILATVKKAPF